MARRLNISPSAVGMYEQGRREPSVEMLVTLSRVLGVSIEFLITGQSICADDDRAKAQIYSRSEGERSLVDSLRVLSREELLVLLTAEIFGSEHG